MVTDEAPVATILTPAEGKTYRAGQKLKFKGTATDAEGDRLPISAYTWEIVFHHDEHTHPFYPATAGRRFGAVLIPRVGETSANVWYRVHLTVTDARGVSATTHRDVFPQKVTLTVDAPAGATIDLDGQPMAAPFSFTAVAGLSRELTAPPQQEIDGVLHTFVGWKGKRSTTLSLVTPAKDRVYAATYLPVR